MSDTPTIIDLKTRGAFVPPAPADGAEPAPLSVCTPSLAVLEACIEQVKAGTLTNIGVTGVAFGLPTFCQAINKDAVMADLAALSVATDSLKDNLRDVIFGFESEDDLPEDLSS